MGFVWWERVEEILISVIWLLVLLGPLADLRGGKGTGGQLVLENYNFFLVMFGRSFIE